MSWITVIWSMTAAACLTLAAIHFLLWCQRRTVWADLVFTLASVGAAVFTRCELSMMLAQTPEQFAAALRWLQVPTWVIVVSLVGFVRLHLRAGRRWLAWSVFALRSLALLLNFLVGQNLNYREVTGLRHVAFLGEAVCLGVGVSNPWMLVGQLSLLLLVIFTVDATITVWRRGDRRQAVATGGSIVLFSLIGMAQAVLVLWRIVALPLTQSFFFLGIVVAIGYELGREALRAARLSDELRESQQRMRLAAIAADLSLWEWDIVRDEIWVTEKGRERAGVDASERIDFGRFLQSVHPEDREPTQRAARHALEVSGDFEAEYRMVGLDGVTRWIMARGRVERDTRRRPLRLRGVSVDVTEHKQAEGELRRLQGEVAHVSRVSTVGQLSTALAHELNQPLGAILSNAEAAELLLEADPPALGQVREILADIRKDDERAGEVIRRMRALLRKREMEMQPMDLGELVHSVLRLISGDAALRKVTVRAEVDSGPLPIRGDWVHLQQVLLNLLVNGLEAAGGNLSGERRVKVQAGRNRAGEIEVSVRDNGPGIPPEQLPRLFEPFFTTKPNGMGMGTSIARTIVQAHHGRIWAENNPDGGGATFRFTLPVDDRPEVEQNPPMPKAEEPRQTKL